LKNEDLSHYKLPKYMYRRKIMGSTAELCRKHGLKFTFEEFFDLWMTSYSDCVDINCWHAQQRMMFGVTLNHKTAGE